MCSAIATKRVGDCAEWKHMMTHVAINLASKFNILLKK